MSDSGDRPARRASTTTTQGGSSTDRRRAEPALDRPRPGLLLAWRPADVGGADRADVARAVDVGRSTEAHWTLLDPRLSKRHFEIRPADGETVVRDLGSTNGTFVNGEPLGGARALRDQDVVRAGRCVFVFVADARPLLAQPRSDPSAHGFSGTFHAGAIVERIEEAVDTGRHLLLEGESGSGKELAARAVHRLGFAGKPFVAQNCAAFASEEEAETTLFGVQRGVFTGVDARAGLIEAAQEGVLYLDELPNLGLRIQRAILRFAESGEYRRFGDTAPRTARVRLVLGTNRRVGAALMEGSLAADLVTRTHRVLQPPLSARRADVPALFLDVFRDAAGDDVGAFLPLLGPDHFETLLLADFTGTNVRLLQDVAAVAAARLRRTPPADRPGTLTRLFCDRFPRSPVVARHAADCAPPPAGGRGGSVYETHREAIIDAYRRCGGNLTAVEDALRDRGITVHRRWLAEFLDRWGVRARRRRG